MLGPFSTVPPELGGGAPGRESPVLLLLGDTGGLIWSVTVRGKRNFHSEAVATDVLTLKSYFKFLKPINQQN